MCGRILAMSFRGTSPAGQAGGCDHLIFQSVFAPHCKRLLAEASDNSKKFVVADFDSRFCYVSQMMLVSNRRLIALLFFMVASLLGLPLLPTILQNQNYHDFADQRTLFGIPNFWNVVSNIPFVGIGAVGLWQFGRSQATMLLFLGIFLTGFVSERAYSQALRCGSR